MGFIVKGCRGEHIQKGTKALDFTPEKHFGLSTCQYCQKIYIKLIYLNSTTVNNAKFDAIFQTLYVLLKTLYHISILII